MSIPNKNFELTSILVKDKKYGGYSAFFAQFPEAIAQGETEEEATDNLYNIFRIMLADKKEQSISQMGSTLEFTTKSVNVAIP